jgi:carboxyl-terminal processing protease
MRSVIVKTIAVFFIWLPGILSSQAQPVSKSVINKREKYFNKIYRLIDENFYYRNNISGRAYFKEFKNKFLQAADDDKAYKVLKEMMYSLEGNHCGFLTPSEVERILQPAVPIFPNGKIIENNIALIEVPTCILSQDLTMSYVDTMQKLIGRLDEHRPGGWIIDLRRNQGGSSAAILAAIGSLFPNGAIYYREDRRGDKHVSKMENGSYMEFREDKLAYSFTPLHKTTLTNKDVPVAVLTSRQTGSAAEIVTIALKSIPRARFFGEPTAGVPTGNVSFVLADQAVVYITRTVLLDVQGVKYTGPIQPDEAVAAGNDSAIIPMAVKWLLHAGMRQDR